MSRSRDPHDPRRDRDGRGRSDAPPDVDPEAPDLLERLGIVVPDDARDLVDDVRRLHRSRLALHPSGRGHGSAPGGRLAWLTEGPALLLVLIMAVVSAAAMVATGLTVVSGPRVTTSSPGALPLPSGAAVEDARLLPRGEVVREGRTMPARDLRPAVLLVTPVSGCETCADTLANVAAQAREYALPVGYVVPEGQEGPATELVRDAAGASADVVTDVGGTLVPAFVPRGSRTEPGSVRPQLVLVHADGVIAFAGPAGPDDRLEPLLAPLEGAGAGRATASAR